MSEQLTTKASFARLAGVSAAAITKACKTILAPAMVGKRIDMNHKAAKTYLSGSESNQRQTIEILDPGEKKPHVRGHSAARELKKRGTDTDNAFTVPENIQAFADMSLRDVIAQFGTDVRFLDWLRATKEIEMINERRIKNAKAAGELVHRDLVKAGVIDPVDAALMKLLTDGSKTITRRATAMHDAGRDLKDIEEFVKDQISSFIRPMKAKIKRAFTDA